MPKVKSSSLSSSNVAIKLFLIIIGMASAPLQFFSNRDVLDLSEDVILESNGVSENFTFYSRLFNGLIFLLLMFFVRGVIISSARLTNEIKFLIFSLFLYLFFNYILGAAFGRYVGFPVNVYLILSIFVLVILTVIKGISSEEIIFVFKWVAGVMLLGSILMGITFPELSYGKDSFNFEFSDSRRLIGLFDHPRQLGIYALFLFAIELRFPSKRWVRSLIISISLLSLFFSVSKTAIFLSVLVVGWHLYGLNKFHRFLVLMSLLISLVYLIFHGDYIKSADNIDNILSLTGRTGLWVLIFESFYSYPFFGNGPFFFSGSGVTSYAHAHNIILQSISDGGLFGLMGLIFYIYSLISISLRNGLSSKSLSVILVFLLLIFSMFEPVMRVDNFVNGSFFINSFVILYLCALDRERMRMSY